MDDGFYPDVFLHRTVSAVFTSLVRLAFGGYDWPYHNHFKTSVLTTCVRKDKTAKRKRRKVRLRGSFKECFRKKKRGSKALPVTTWQMRKECHIRSRPAPLGGVVAGIKFRWADLDLFTFIFYADFCRVQTVGKCDSGQNETRPI